jgi:hypothetical protein
MGATQLNRPKGTTTAAFLAQEFGAEYTKAVRATAMVGNIYYAVVEVPAAENDKLVPDENGMVRYAYCVITHKGSGFYNFTYREMTEFAGPCDATCPVKLLNMLSPLKDETKGSSEWAAKWRRRCGEFAKVKEALKRVGAELTLPSPISFSDKVMADRFRVDDRAGKLIIRRTVDGARVRLSDDLISSLSVAA